MVYADLCDQPDIVLQDKEKDLRYVNAICTPCFFPLLFEKLHH